MKFERILAGLLTRTLSCLSHLAVWASQLLLNGWLWDCCCPYHFKISFIWGTDPQIPQWSTAHEEAVLYSLRLRVRNEAQTSQDTVSPTAKQIPTIPPPTPSVTWMRYLARLPRVSCCKMNPSVQSAGAITEVCHLQYSFQIQKYSLLSFCILIKNNSKQQSLRYSNNGLLAHSTK